jgi:hypothetical protein
VVLHANASIIGLVVSVPLPEFALLTGGHVTLGLRDNLSRCLLHYASCVQDVLHQAGGGH